VVKRSYNGSSIPLNVTPFSMYSFTLLSARVRLSPLLSYVG
jgi:hypothetical protein